VFGTIKQKYSGSGTVDYQSTYTDGVLTVQNIDVDGPGSFKTVLKPKNTWTANADYTEDITISNPDTGTGTTVQKFPHLGSSSFTGSGFYTIN